MLDGFDVARGNYHNLPMVYDGVHGWLYGDVGHSCPGRIECRVRMNYIIQLMGGSGVIIRRERWLRCLLMER